MSPLTLVPDYPTEPFDGEYRFSGYQEVTLTATLEQPGANIGDGTLVYFANVGVATGLELQPIGNNWVPAGDDVGVKLKKEAGVDKWQAQLKVLVAGEVPGDGTTYAYIGTSYQSNNLNFTVGQSYSVCPSYIDDFWLAFSVQDQSPDSPGNNYLYYRFQVTDPDSHVGLRNIRVRVKASLGTPDAMRKVLLYDNYSGGTSLNSDDHVDLVTDINGVAELYLCPKAGVSAIGALTWKVGTNEGSLGPFMIVDPEEEWTTVEAPQTTENPVPLDGSPIEVAHIPQYVNIAPNQWIFLLCNGRYQSSTMLQVSDVGPGTDITLPFEKSVLRSKSEPYDDSMQNVLLYVVYAVDIRVSSEWKFKAMGTPPQAQPDSTLPQTLTPPLLMENLAGWPINCASLSKELHIRLPLDQPQIEIDDEIRLHIYLNGYRRGSDEPLGIEVRGPEDLHVTQYDLDLGFIEWPLVPIPFWGFGEMHSTGELGTLRACYDVVRGASGIVYSSRNLLLGIDTILPTGYGNDPF